jgi:hypothetical protein
MMLHLLPAALGGVLLALRPGPFLQLRGSLQPRRDSSGDPWSRGGSSSVYPSALRWRTTGSAVGAPTNGQAEAGHTRSGRGALSLPEDASGLGRGPSILPRNPPGLGQDVLAAVLLLAALAKPNATLPLVGLALVITRRLRPLLLALTGYLALTLFALSFQTSGPGELLTSWFPTARGVAATSGYGHLGVALGALGLESWLPVASLLVLTGWLVWASHHRTADPWVLLALGALVARTFTYHQYYDDLLLLVPTVVLLRIARHSSSPAVRTRALIIFGAALLAALAPTSLHSLASPWAFLCFELPQILIWAAMLAVLVPEAGRPATGSLMSSEPVALGTPV